MKLQARFLLLLTIVFLSVAGLLFVQRNFDLQRSHQVLKSGLDQRKKLFTTNLQSEGKTFQIFSEDYSFWDEMVNFTKTEDLEFAKLNIDPGLDTFEATNAWVYRPDGSLLYAAASEGTKSAPAPAMPANFFKKITADKFGHFYTETPEGVLEVRAATIVPSDDSDHASTPAGFWVIGRYLDDNFIHSIEDVSQSTVKLLPASENATDKIGGSTVDFSIPLKNLEGQTVKLLNSSSQISLVSELDVLYKRELVLLGIVSAVLLALITLAIWWFVLRPVRQIALSISNQKPEMLSRISSSNSQFGDLARTVEQFFKQRLVIQEDQFKKAELERLNREKASFLAVAAHELKSPIAIIKLLAEDLPRTLPSGQNSPAVNEQLSMITHQSAKMATLINDMRLTSQGTEETPLVKSVFDFDEFLRKEITEMGYIIEHKLEYSGTTGKQVSADPDRLSQVISNLIKNAAKYSPDANKIIIRTLSSENRVVVEIEDFGIGISPEDRAQIFTRFYRAPSVTERFEGLGVGLSICKSILERMGGSIWVQSEVGKGSSFYFSLPFVDYIR